MPAEVRLYDHLFNRPDPGADGDVIADLNPESLEVLTGCQVEPALAQAPRRARRCSSSGRAISASTRTARPDRLVFNRTVGLRDTWAKVQASGNRGR